MACSTAAMKHTGAFVACQQAPRRARMVVAASARQEPAETGRRTLLAAGIALLAATQSQQAQARPEGVTASGTCAIGDDGAECRQAIIAKDTLPTYEQASDNAGKVGNRVTNVPVADLSSKYAQDTIALTDKILKYASFADPTDPERFKVIKELKADMPVWVSRYARGGSVRATSARKIYVVVDAISAHFATNGLAPFPAAKLRKLVADVEAGLEALSKGT